MMICFMMLHHQIQELYKSVCVYSNVFENRWCPPLSVGSSPIMHCIYCRHIRKWWHSENISRILLATPKHLNHATLIYRLYQDWSSTVSAQLNGKLYMPDVFFCIICVVSAMGGPNLLPWHQQQVRHFDNFVKWTRCNMISCHTLTLPNHLNY